MFLVDTNVLVYAANADSPEHATCRALLEGWRRQAGAWYTTWGVLYEFLRVTTHPRVLREPLTLPGAWSFVAAVVASPSLRVLSETPRHAAVVSEIADELSNVSGNLVHDLHIAALMREHGLRVIYTRDSDFHRFPFLEPVDPLR